MAAFFLSGRVVDVVLAVVALEFLAAVWWRGRGAGAMASLLLPGVFLLLALRAALVGADWRWLAAALLAAFGAHLQDVRRRWRA